MPKPSKRDQLVEATKALLWDVGYEAMSPRDIQARSAARPGSLYHHFPSKLAIAGEALAAATAEEIARLDEVFADGVPPLEAIRSYILLDRDVLRGCRLGRLVQEASIENDVLRQPVAAYFEALRNHIARSLLRAQSDGTFEACIDPEALAVSLTALIQGGYVLARTFRDETLMGHAQQGALALISELRRPPDGPAGG